MTLLAFPTVKQGTGNRPFSWEQSSGDSGVMPTSYLLGLLMTVTIESCAITQRTSALMSLGGKPPSFLSMTCGCYQREGTGAKGTTVLLTAHILPVAQNAFFLTEISILQSWAQILLLWERLSSLQPTCHSRNPHCSLCFLASYLFSISLFHIFLSFEFIRLWASWRQEPCFVGFDFLL